MKRCSWPLPGKPVEPSPNIWEEIKDYIITQVDLKDPRQYDLLTVYIKATWIREAFPVIPYLQIMGPKNSGKTRLGEVIQQLCYRGILASNISTATFYRIIDLYHPALILDEPEIYLNAKKTEIQNLLNSGYRVDQFAIRMGGENFDIPSFSISLGLRS